MSAADLPVTEVVNRSDRQTVATTPHHRAMAPWLVRCINGYIGVHLHVTIRNADIARVAQCGPSRFKRIFRETFGCTPHRETK
jgi:AraC-like DNA-binding protein